MKTKITKALRRRCDQLNGIIASRNLYHHRFGRFYCAEIIDGVLTVESLHSGIKMEYVDGDYTDCSGHTVFLD
jgi:hypothetical protein